MTAATLTLSLCSQSHRWLATALISLILASSGILFELGQPSIFAISSLIIGSCLFFRDRCLPLGAVLLMLSLAVKPQIGGLIVLYLLVRGIHRRYALAALAGALALFMCAGMILKMRPISAEWITDLSANVSATVNSGFNDPRPANEQAVCDINLQAITGIFFTDVKEFNTAAWAVFLLLLAVGAVVILRAKSGLEMNLLSLAALAALSLTPVYHRFYDSRMLLITIPAAMIVYQKRRLLGTFIVALSVLAEISVQSRVQRLFDIHAAWHSILQNKVFFILLLRQQNLELPMIFCLYMIAIYSIQFPSAPEKPTALPAH